MDLTKILSISGKPGLFKMVGETKSGLIVESLEDNKKFPVFSHEQISSLKEISIYTETDSVSLKEVLKKVRELQQDKPVDNPKKASADVLKALFVQIVPDYDKDAVYVSDMKKVFTWYNLLLKNNMLDFTDDEDEEVAETEEKPSEKSTEKEKDTDEKEA
ncbi:MAG: DUF5606 domain-containing protein [Bacteroidales bacterium]|jgi:hypothetical protein|nr:DUF5606 domain-containing protein [Bacteroidales bacterium]